MRMTKTPEEINMIAMEEGKKIYLELIEKYPPLDKDGTESLFNFDIVLNSLVMGLICLQHQFTDSGEGFAKLVSKILLDNKRPGS